MRLVLRVLRVFGGLLVFLVGTALMMVLVTLGVVVLTGAAVLLVLWAIVDSGG